jgi:cyclase
MVFHSNHKYAELLTYGGGHSISDSFLYLPEKQILFLADLMHIGHHADFRQGNIDEWINILDELKKLEVKVIVSGHGSLGAKEDLTIMQDYLLNMKKLALDLFNKGTAVENIGETKIPKEFADYQIPSVFYGTLKYLIEKLQNE